MLIELIIIVFIKLMGAAVSGHWDLGDTGTSRDYDALVRSLGWQCECTNQTLFGAVPVARCLGAVQPDSPAKPTAPKRHILASRTCLAANMAAPTDS